MQVWLSEFTGEDLRPLADEVMQEWQRHAAVLQAAAANKHANIKATASAPRHDRPSRRAKVEVLSASQQTASSADASDNIKHHPADASSYPISRNGHPHTVASDVQTPGRQLGTDLGGGAGVDLDHLD